MEERWWRLGPLVLAKHSPKRFSERYGYTKVLRLGHWSLEWRP